MTIYMTQTEYAEHRGISQPRVSKLISTGKISDCIKKISGKKLIDRDKADAALAENLDRVYNKPTRQYGKNKKSRERPTQEEQVRTIKSAGLKILSLADAQELKENYNAALKKLEYETKKRELIPVDNVKKALSGMVLTARSKILSIKGTLAPLIKEFVDDPENFGIAMDSIENTIRDILDEMATCDVE